MRQFIITSVQSQFKFRFLAQPMNSNLLFKFYSISILISAISENFILLVVAFVKICFVVIEAEFKERNNLHHYYLMHFHSSWI